MRTTILRRGFLQFGASLAAGARGFLLGSDPGSEIKHVIFTFVDGGPGTEQIDLKWRLRHPEEGTKPLAILLRGEVGRIDSNRPTIFSQASGSMGYHRALHLVIEDPVTDNAKAIVDLQFEIHFIATSGTEEDKGIHEVPQPQAGEGLRLM